MTSQILQELAQMRTFAEPFRFRVILNADEEAIMPGMHGQVEC